MLELRIFETSELQIVEKSMHFDKQIPQLAYAALVGSNLQAHNWACDRHFK
jgi:hypothetical protein